MQRELGPTEAFFAFAHEHHAMLVVNAINITGKIDPNRLKAAIAKVKTANPILCMRTIQENGQWFFHHSAHDDIELKVTRSTTHCWQDIAQDEIHTPFDITSNKPLIRFHLIHVSHSQQVLLLVGSHVILDGVSSTSIIEQTLQVYSNPDMQLTAHPLQPALDALCKHSSVNPEHIPQDTLATDEEITQVIDVTSSETTTRKNRLLTLTFNQSTTNALISLCRQQGVTMNALLYTAAQKAIYSISGTTASLSVTSGGNTNFRNACKPNLNQEDIGCYVSMFGFRANVTSNIEQWDLARYNHEVLQNCFNSTALVYSTRHEFWSNLLSSAAIHETSQWRQGRFNLLHLSNMGRLSLDQHYGDITIDHYHFFAGQHVLGTCYWLGALTINQQLCVSIITIDPIISEARTQSFKDKLCVELYAMAKIH